MFRCASAQSAPVKDVSKPDFQHAERGRETVSHFHAEQDSR